jgi:3-oxoacyl-[acyl-carrier-protein] synthase-3
VLLLVGDTVSKFVNAKDLTAAALFGDGGSATLVDYREETAPSFFSLKTDGSGYEALIIPAGGYRTPRTAQNSQAKKDADGNWRSDCDLHMNGGDVFNFTIREEPKAVFEILEYAHVDKENIDHFFFHQANRYILSNITKRIKVPIEKVPCDLVSRYGNQSSASIPVTIAETVREGSRTPLRILMSGFGVGLSWATAVLNLDPSVVLPLADYPNSEVASEYLNESVSSN